jgi:DNA-binding NarL/FixJ family response regulator
VAAAAIGLITVLIADDDSQVRSALSHLVARSTSLHLVEAVADGRAAGAAAGRHRPMVAVVDVRMPWGGVEAIEAIRASSPDTAIVVYTAYGDPVTEREMRLAGACQFLVKGDRRSGVVDVITAAAADRTDLR